MKKKIIVVDDEPLIAVLMKEVVEEGQDFEIAQMTAERDDFLNLVSRGSFDAGIVDISVGCREGGIELLQMIKNKGIDLPIIILSAHDEYLYALKCLQAGARGYINKKYICTEVVRCLKLVFDGRLFVSGDKGEQILEQYRRMSAPVNAEHF